MKWAVQRLQPIVEFDVIKSCDQILPQGKITCSSTIDNIILSMVQ